MRRLFALLLVGPLVAIAAEHPGNVAEKSAANCAAQPTESCKESASKAASGKVEHGGTAAKSKSVEQGGKAVKSKSDEHGGKAAKSKSDERGGKAAGQKESEHAGGALN